MIITRKIQLLIDADNDERKLFYEKLYKINWGVRRCANIISSHLFHMDNVKDMMYLTDEIKIKLADIQKDEQGILTTSYQNSLYRLISSMYKGEIPTDILTNLVNNIVRNYKSEKLLVWQGKKSLRSYKDSIPIPFSKKYVAFTPCEKWYELNLFKIPFKTYLGKDRNNNRVMIDRIITGEYEASGSSLQISKNKIFLLLCINIPEKEKSPDQDKAVIAHLSPFTPIIASIGRKKIEIGSFEEYMHKKIAIQAKRQRMQRSAKYTKGGKGRNKKMKILEKDSIAKKEANYLNTMLHTYSKILVKFALDHNAGKIILIKDEPDPSKAKMLLENWGYYNLKTKIEYKAKIEGIEVVEETLMPKK
jgi:transposase